jgi:hypothetical protein
LPVPGWPGLVAVVREWECPGEGDRPEGIFCQEETARVFAAILPLVEREPLFHLAETQEGEAGFAVSAVYGEQGPCTVGWLRRSEPELIAALHLAEALVRRPASLAVLLQVAGGRWKTASAGASLSPGTSSGLHPRRQLSRPQVPRPCIPSGSPYVPDRGPSVPDLSHSVPDRGHSVHDRGKNVPWPLAMSLTPVVASQGHKDLSRSPFAAGREPSNRQDWRKLCLFGAGFVSLRTKGRYDRSQGHDVSSQGRCDHGPGGRDRRRDERKRPMDAGSVVRDALSPVRDAVSAGETRRRRKQRRAASQRAGSEAVRLNALASGYGACRLAVHWAPRAPSLQAAGSAAVGARPGVIPCD